MVVINLLSLSTVKKKKKTKDKKPKNAAGVKAGKGVNKNKKRERGEWGFLLQSSSVRLICMQLIQFIVKRNRKKLWLDFARRVVSLLQSCHQNYVGNEHHRS